MTICTVLTDRLVFMLTIIARRKAWLYYFFER